MRWWFGLLVFGLALSACDGTRPLVTLQPEGDAGEAGSLDSGQCHPGETRCHGQLAFQSCTPDGEWSASQSCAGYSEDGTSSYCAWVTSGAQSWAACVDPACWWWLGNGLDDSSTHGGVCGADGAFRACEASGVLGPSEPCAGQCREVAQLDGRRLGYCVAECRAGERECVAGPLYRECQNGAWSTPRACAAGEACQPLAAGALLDIRCGGDCIEGTSHCSADRLRVESCADGGTECSTGRCVQSGAQAQCQLECQPETVACAFDGDVFERKCSELGRWLVPTACATNERCRVGSAAVIGCAECAPGDSLCVEDSIASCGADNVFAPPIACPKACVQAGAFAYCE